MAKKKGGKKGSSSKRYKAATNGTGKPIKGRDGKTRKVKPARKPGPRSQTLPGMEQVRDGALDRLCEAIGECRATMNSAKQEETGLEASALQRMARSSERFPNGRTVYKHAGVELARIPGADKLRVRLVKEKGDATENDQVGDDRREAVEELGNATAAGNYADADQAEEAAEAGE